MAQDVSCKTVVGIGESARKAQNMYAQIINMHANTSRASIDCFTPISAKRCALAQGKSPALHAFGLYCSDVVC